MYNDFTVKNRHEIASVLQRIIYVSIHILKNVSFSAMKFGMNLPYSHLGNVTPTPKSRILNGMAFIIQ